MVNKKTKFLFVQFFLILLRISPINGQDTLSYFQHHFKVPVVFADSIAISKCIALDSSIQTERTDNYGLKSIRIDCKFVGFSNATFDSLADFKLIKFKNNVQFYNSLFLGRSSFAYDVFDGKTSFNGCIFNDPNIDYSSKTFDLDINGGTSFLETQFKKYTDFDGVYFKNEAFFVKTIFFDVVSFDQTDFRKVVHFNDVAFSNVAYFNMVNFTEGVDFGGAVLPDTLYFRYVSEIGKEMDLTSCVLNPEKKVCYLNLVGSNIDKIRINYDQFKLYFLQRDTENEITYVYQKLLKKFQDDGFTDSYQKLDVEFQKYRYNKAGQWFRSWLQEWWWNFGYNKEKIFQNSLILLLFFFILNVLIGIKYGYNFLIKEVYEVENIEQEVERLQAKYASRRIKLFFSWLPMVFIYTCMLFFILNLNIKHLRYRHKYALTYLLSVFMVGLICAAYIINFVLDK